MVPWTFKPKLPLEDAGSTVALLPPKIVVPLAPWTIVPTASPLLLALGGLFTTRTTKELAALYARNRHEHPSKFKSLYAESLT